MIPPRQAWIRLCRRVGSRLQRRDAFSLAELLIVAGLGTLLLGGAISIVLINVRTTDRIAALRQLQEHCGWIQFLINHEIEQAQQSASGEGRLSLTVPGFADPTIIYRFDPSTRELRRTGPRIDAQGRLLVPADPNSEPLSDLVARDVVSFVVNATNPRSPRYRITLEDATGNTYTVTQDDGRDGGAYCRARVIS